MECAYTSLGFKKKIFNSFYVNYLNWKIFCSSNLSLLRLKFQNTNDMPISIKCFHCQMVLRKSWCFFPYLFECKSDPAKMYIWFEIKVKTALNFNINLSRKTSQVKEWKGKQKKDMMKLNLELTCSWLAYVIKRK